MSDGHRHSTVDIAAKTQAPEGRDARLVILRPRGWNLEIASSATLCQFQMPGERTANSGEANPGSRTENSLCAVLRSGGEMQLVSLGYGKVALPADRAPLVAGSSGLERCNASASVTFLASKDLIFQLRPIEHGVSIQSTRA